MRNNSLDTFRFFAAFAVITLHVGYGNLSETIVDNIRLLGRFAVPFFFLVSGYFFFINFQKSGDKYFVKTIQRLIGIFIIASFVFSFIKFQRLSFSFSLLYDGTNLHLWFLSSMIFGIIICWYHYSYLKSKSLMVVLSLTIILLSLLSDSYSAVFPYKLNGDFCRYLLSIPYLFFGALIAENKYRLSKTISIMLIIFGIMLQVTESFFLLHQFGYDISKHQFLIGTIPFALGVFFLSFDGFSRNTLAELGRKYSLSIYVYHQFINFFLFKVIRFLFGQSADSVFVFSPLLSFGFTLLSLIIVERYLPVLFAVLNGELKMISQVFVQKSLNKVPKMT